MNGDGRSGDKKGMGGGGMVDAFNRVEQVERVEGINIFTGVYPFFERESGFHPDK